MEISPTLTLVVAVALMGRDGRVLMQQRRADRAHGGLWEFPGGKVEPGESLESAAIREIDEELGVSLQRDNLIPVSFASDAGDPSAGRAPLVILLYKCAQWHGKPQAHDAAAVDWFEMEAIGDLAMPPLDYPLWISLKEAKKVLANRA